MPDSAMIDGAVKLVQGVGLPALFCAWLMIRVEKRLDAQTETLGIISESLGRILEHMRDDRND